MQESDGLFELWHWNGKGWHETQELAGLHLVALGHGSGFCLGAQGAQ